MIPRMKRAEPSANKPFAPPVCLLERSSSPPSASVVMLIHLLWTRMWTWVGPLALVQGFVGPGLVTPPLGAPAQLPLVSAHARSPIIVVLSDGGLLDDASARGALDTQEVGVDDTDATRAFAANRTQDGGSISQPSKKGFESLRVTAVSGVEELKWPLDGARLTARLRVTDAQA